MPCWRLLAVYFPIYTKWAKGTSKSRSSARKNLSTLRFWQADIEALERILLIFQFKPLE